MKVEKEFVLREIAGEYVIIPTGKTVLAFNVFFASPFCIKLQKVFVGRCTYIL